MKDETCTSGIKYEQDYVLPAVQVYRDRVDSLSRVSIEVYTDSAIVTFC